MYLLIFAFSADVPISILKVASLGPNCRTFAVLYTSVGLIDHDLVDHGQVLILFQCNLLCFFLNLIVLLFSFFAP